MDTNGVTGRHLILFYHAFREGGGEMKKENWIGSVSASPFWKPVASSIGGYDKPQQLVLEPQQCLFDLQQGIISLKGWTGDQGKSGCRYFNNPTMTRP